MRILILILTLTFTNITYAQDYNPDTYSGDGYVIQVAKKTMPQTEIVNQVKAVIKKIVKKKPAELKNLDRSIPAPPKASVALTTSYYKGGIYFGGEKVPADFSYIGIDLLIPSKEWADFGLSVGYLFNKSSVKVYNVNFYIGYKHKINDEMNLRVGPMIGFSLYNEKTNIQQVTAMGLQIGSKIQVDYTLKSGLYIGAGLNWRHDMFASTFWGKDPFSDVVLDFIGPQVTLGWNF